MKDKTLKIGIIICFIVIIILIICISVFLFNKKNSEVVEDEETLEYINKLKEDRVNNTTQNLSKISEYYEYFDIKTCVDKYFSLLNNTIISNQYDDMYESNVNIKEEKKKLSKENLAKVYQVLDEEFLNKKGLTENNLDQYYKDYKNSSFEIKTIYKQKNTDNIEQYIVYGLLLNNEKFTSETSGLIVNIDTSNNTFSIFPPKYLEENKYLDLKQGDEIEKTNKNNIVANEFNKIELNNNSTVSEEKISKELFNKYKNTLTYAKEQLYNDLNSEYKKAKNKTLEEYVKILKEKENYLLKRKLSKYKMYQENGYKEYVLIDDDNNYYIFNDRGVMNYDLMLDTYTSDYPEFVDKYNSSNNYQKFKLNFTKIITAIDKEDYEYVYSKLDDNFKKNNYNTLNKLEQYIKENLSDISNAEYSNFKVQGSTYSCDLKVNTDEIEGESKKSEVKTIKVLMKFKEGTNFVISFFMQ